MSISKKKKLRNRKSRKGKNFLYRLYGSYGTAKEQRKGKRNRKSRKPKNFLNRLYGGYGRPNILKETTAELTQEESDRMERERRAIERPYSPLAPNWMGNMEAARARKAAAAARPVRPMTTGHPRRTWWRRARRGSRSSSRNSSSSTTRSLRRSDCGYSELH